MPVERFDETTQQVRARDAVCGIGALVALHHFAHIEIGQVLPAHRRQVEDNPLHAVRALYPADVQVRYKVAADNLALRVVQPCTGKTARAAGTTVARLGKELLPIEEGHECAEILPLHARNRLQGEQHGLQVGQEIFVVERIVHPLGVQQFG